MKEKNENDEIAELSCDAIDLMDDRGKNLPGEYHALRDEYWDQLRSKIFEINQLVQERKAE